MTVLGLRTGSMSEQQYILFNSLDIQESLAKNREPKYPKNMGRLTSAQFHKGLYNSPSAVPVRRHIGPDSISTSINTTSA